LFFFFFEEKEIFIPVKFEDLPLTKETKKGLMENKFIALRQIQVNLKSFFLPQRKKLSLCLFPKEQIITGHRTSGF
jgi:hypothetical protein